MIVDTNIPIDILREISDYQHVAVMLSPQAMSVERFFGREDPEKQFILKQIQQAADPEKTMENYRACLAAINSPEAYRSWEEAGFFILVRSEARTPQQTLAALEEHFGL